jgi:two-component system, cell cycle sensor histidine kinase and response regulator CckA
MKQAILIVDDEVDNLGPLKVFLQLHGYLVEIASDGTEALQSARKHLPAVVISDLLMPGMDGYALCREWKSDPVFKEIPFIVTTAAYLSKDDEAFAKELGVDCYIRKPINPNKLIDEIKKFTTRSPDMTPVGRLSIEDESEIFRRHGERLQCKLEEKIRDLEHEIVERKEIESDLRESRERLRAIIETTPDAIIVTDLDGTIIHTSKKTADLYGVEDAEIFIGKNIKEFIPLSEQKNLAKDIRTLLRHGSIGDSEYTIAKNDGEEKVVEISAARLKRSPDNPQSFVCVIRNITDRKQAEESLRKSEEKNRNLFETMQQGVVYFNSRGIITEANPSAQNILGIPLEDLIGKSSYEIELDAIDEDGNDVPVHQYPSQTALVEGTAVQDSIMGIYNKEKERYVWIKIGAVPQFKKGKSTPHQVNLIFDDITGWRELESQISQAQKMETIGHLVAGVAHDYNNILAIVLGSAEMGIMAAEMGEINPEIVTSLQDILAASERAKGLTQQLLGFAKKGKNDQQNIDINSVVKEVTYLLRRGLSSTVPISVKYENKATENILADGTQLHQVIQNLAVNAKDAMPEGGCITIATADIKVGGALTGAFGNIPGNNYVRLSVSDTGLGIDPKILHNIFDPYFTTKGKRKGTGLGLATVYDIITNHRSYIRVHSEQGKGSSFEIYFPAVQRKTESIINKSCEDLKGNGKILIVDDEQVLTKVINTYLMKRGFAVTSVPDTFSGMEKLEHDSYDVILTDIIMEAHNGLEFVRRAKRNGYNGKVVLMSGYQEDEKIRRALENEADVFIQKPFTLDSLGTILVEICAGT